METETIGLPQLLSRGGPPVAWGVAAGACLVLAVLQPPLRRLVRA